MKNASRVFFGSLLVTANITVVPIAVASPADYSEAIQYLREQKIADGYSNGDFGENLPVNRAEITKIIMNATHEKEEGVGTNCFLDVQHQWFSSYVCAAKDGHMVSGYPDGTFRPEQTVTFAEAASLVVRAYGESVNSYDKTWYTPYLKMLGDWKAVPYTVRTVHAPLTRGEMAYIIWMADMHQKDAVMQKREEKKKKDNDREEEVELVVSASKTYVTAGDTVTFSIVVENKGDIDADFDIQAAADSNLRIIHAPLADLTDHSAEWEDEYLREDDEKTYTITARVDSLVSSGSILFLTVKAGDEKDAATIVVQSQTPLTSSSALGDPILYWNNIALQAIAYDHTGTYGTPLQMGPGASTRSLAMVHAAMFDAVNSIDASYTPYIASVHMPPGKKANIDAAAAVAAHKTLVHLYPDMKISFDIDLARYLDSVAHGDEKTLGMLVGDMAATQVINTRINDGSITDFVHQPSIEPGKHRQDPINPDQIFLSPKWGAVRPFVMNTGSQFRPSPPPAITSKEYADAFNEVKLLGGDGVTTPTIRTTEQTEIGIFWAYDGTKKIGTPPRMFNQIAQVVAVQQKNTTVQNARLFALLNLAMADAAIACWEAKYYYDYWRPIIGIREAEVGTGPTGLGDNNPLTTGDSQWTPLGAPMSNMTMNNFTPPFPSFTSGHATMGEATFRTLANFYGTDNVSFTFTSDEYNGVTTDNAGSIRPLKPRKFSSFSQASRENADSRIYLGVHWRFDQNEGVKMGKSIADYVFANALKSVR